MLWTSKLQTKCLEWNKGCMLHLAHCIFLTLMAHCLVVFLFYSVIYSGRAVLFSIAMWCIHGDIYHSEDKTIVIGHVSTKLNCICPRLSSSGFIPKQLNLACFTAFTCFTDIWVISGKAYFLPFKISFIHYQWSSSLNCRNEYLATDWLSAYK